MDGGKVRVPNEENNWGLPDGTHVTIPGGLYTMKRLIKTVNWALKEAGKRYRYDRKGEIRELSPVEGEGPGPVEVDLSGMAAQLPPPLQFWCGLCAVISFCEREKDTPAWMVAKRMYQKWITEANPEGWPTSFKEFVEKNFKEFEIPATVRSGIILAGAGDLSKIRAAQGRLDGEGR
jgi:hypothetical protein